MKITGLRSTVVAVPTRKVRISETYGAPGLVPRPV